MLRLSKLYSNNEKIFPEICFRTGLNVIFASVTKGLEKKDSHSLGKTLLVELIDYMLLKQPGAEFFLNKDVFKEFIFYLELQISQNSFITIRRSPNEKIYLHTSQNKENLLSLKETDWEYSKLGLEAAKTKLDEILSLIEIMKMGFSYRKGLRYCLRKQSQYEETFKVNTSRERDLYWKPYLAGLLGIDSNLVKAKYEFNKDVENIQNAIKELKDLPKVSSQGLEAEIAQIETSLAKMLEELDQFDFRKADVNLNRELVDDVSEKISQLNGNLYIYDQRISAINKSLKAEFNFDLDKILEIYNEIEFHMPEKLIKSYKELIQLNEQMTDGRKKRLKKVKKDLLSKREKISSELNGLNETLSKLSKMLLEEKVFDKYKSLQKMYAAEEARMAVLKERLTKIDMAEALNGRLDDAIAKKNELSKKIAPFTSVRGNEQLLKAVELFIQYEGEVLGIGAFFFVKMNKEGNPSFKIGLKDQTSVADGFSYKRVLAALFDLMLLSLHKKESFYRFVYHDGLLESLDDRVKRRILKLWRSESKKNDLQLIVSVLDSDVPSNDQGAKEYFKEDEIIRELHDRGDDGRLFKMPAF
ncbi:MAG: DUF2326 domain-containing protein [Desulfobacula sp.]|nr:DUF2326 domain-containing protein [Desulfobacula sp.]